MERQKNFRPEQRHGQKKEFWQLFEYLEYIVDDAVKDYNYLEVN